MLGNLLKNTSWLGGKVMHYSGLIMFGAGIPSSSIYGAVTAANSYDDLVQSTNTLKTRLDAIDQSIDSHIQEGSKLEMGLHAKIQEDLQYVHSNSIAMKEAHLKHRRHILVIEVAFGFVYILLLFLLIVKFYQSKILQLAVPK
jgi:hypothetical protein